MKILVQRCLRAKVDVDGKTVGKAGKGYMLLVGITDTDDEKIADKLVEKVINLRIFEDEQGKMNLSILDVKGEILAISQFTLYADCVKGNRPSFIKAARPEKSEPLYEYFVEKLNEKVHTEKGIFGADMKVDFVNDGPVTIMLEKENEVK